jgi:sporulation protein YqfC
MGLPETVLPGTPEFTVTAGRRLVVWSHNGVIEAMSDLVCLDCGAFHLKIHGEGLKIEAIGGERACITGRIKAIFI